MKAASMFTTVTSSMVEREGLMGYKFQFIFGVALRQFSCFEVSSKTLEVLFIMMKVLITPYSLEHFSV